MVLKNRKWTFGIENNSSDNATTTIKSIKPTIIHPQRGSWIRGVNIGGWLVAERFITPYLFAVNTCHLEGNFCTYPGQIGHKPSPSSSKDNDNNNYNPCDMTQCKPVRDHYRGPGSTSLEFDYPVDEYTLSKSFGGNDNKDILRQYMERHWDTFVTKNDIRKLKKAGVTHLRVPLGYWIRGSGSESESEGGQHGDDEPYVFDKGWKYFVRLISWVRDIGGMEVWPDLHGAPGSQNGFDNSGQYIGNNCAQWTHEKSNIERTIQAITIICNSIVEDKLQDVVTGFGLLNEPFYCNLATLRDFYNRSFHIARDILGDETALFFGDNFQPTIWNDGFWIDESKYHNTFLDSHPYHIFFEQGRAFTPRQHIAFVCQHTYNNEVAGCCYEDHPHNTIPSKGVGHIIGEWSSIYDTDPNPLTLNVMKFIAENGSAPLLNYTLSSDRKAFMKNFVEAQMVAYEASTVGVSSGWMYWNFKMELRLFSEWNFLLGLEEGWIPQLPSPNVSSRELYGSCEDILYQTDDNYSIVNEYPDPRTLDWRTIRQQHIFDDDFVIDEGEYVPHPSHHRHFFINNKPIQFLSFTVVLVIVVYFVKKIWSEQKKRREYIQLTEASSLALTAAA